MALVKVDTPHKKWLITPRDIVERSALLKLPSKKWMTTLNMFFVPMNPANARHLHAEIEAGQLSFLLDQDTLWMKEQMATLMLPTRKDRVFPPWYQFNNAKFAPAEHQIEALKRIYPVDASALLMEMGTMKTRVMIDMVSAHFFERRIQFAIVIVPLTVKMTTWVDELANFSPCPYNFIDVDSDYNAKSFRVYQDRMTWVLVGIESLSQGVTFKALEPITRMGIPYACLVDESTRIANWKAICTQAAFSLRKNAAIRTIATGFEIKKNLEDLFAQFEFLDPNIIGCGDALSFRKRYCLMGGYKNKEVIGYDHIDELMGLVTPHVFQCDKSILRLPPKLYERRIVKMTSEQRKVYDSIKRGEIDTISVAHAMTKTIRLRQVACGYYNTDRVKKGKIHPLTGIKAECDIEPELVEVVPPKSNPKIRELLLLAKEISHPMIVWCESLYEIRIVTEALGKLGEVLSIVGDTPKGDRNGIVKRFQTGDVLYFVGTAAAGGIGTTLTAARTVAYMSNSERLEYRVQSEDRAHRKGQTGSVTVIDIAAERSVDLSILRNHADKIDVAMYVKRALKSRILIDKFYDGEVDEAIMAELRDAENVVLDQVRAWN